MNFQEAIKACFQKYADFNGRAKMPEFWWFALFCVVGAFVLEFASSYISWAFSLATLIPSLAAGARRLHDINKSGWMQLIVLIPIFGLLYLIYLLVQEGDVADNQYGAVPPI